MERLRNHIKKGCLPGLLPGEGTEPNERLHHTLNKARLCGVTTIGQERAFAILTLLFYSINCKIDGKKTYRKLGIIPFIPLLASQEVHLRKVTSLNQESTAEMQLDNVGKLIMIMIKTTTF